MGRGNESPKYVIYPLVRDRIEMPTITDVLLFSLAERPDTKPCGKVLYSPANNVQTHQCLIAAKYGKAEINFQPTSSLGELRNRKVDGRLPVLTDGEVFLSGSNAISWYLFRESTGSMEDADKSRVIQWMVFAESEITPLISNWVLPVLGVELGVERVKDLVKRSREEMKNVLSKLDQTLLLKTYFVGERISLADISLFCSLLPLYHLALDPKVRKPYPNLNRWFVTVLNQSNVRSVVGKVTLCEKEPCL